MAGRLRHATGGEWRRHAQEGLDATRSFRRSRGLAAGRGRRAGAGPARVEPEPRSPRCARSTSGWRRSGTGSPSPACDLCADRALAARASPSTTSRNMAPTSGRRRFAPSGSMPGRACSRWRPAGRPSAPGCGRRHPARRSTAGRCRAARSARQRLVRADGAHPRRARRRPSPTAAPTLAVRRGDRAAHRRRRGGAGLREPLPADPRPRPQRPRRRPLRPGDDRASPPMPPTMTSWPRSSRTNSPTMCSRHRVRLDAGAACARGFLGNFGRNARRIRETEVEADRLSVYLMERAGYDPEAAVRFWSRFGRRGLNFLGSPTHPNWRLPHRSCSRPRSRAIRRGAGGGAGAGAGLRAAAALILRSTGTSARRPRGRSRSAGRWRRRRCRCRSGWAGRRCPR